MEAGEAALTDLKTWYKNKNIFITGSTGFLGICLLEKILRCIPEAGNIYLLLRPKKDKDINERLEEIKKNLVFEKLFEIKSVEEAFAKVRAIAGDVSQPDLGISEADRKILTENVNVIIHSAASLDFKETLKPNVDINVLGTRRCLELGKQCTNLNVFVHVSSAYVNSFRKDCKEIIYDLAQDPEHIISLCSSHPESELDEMTPSLLGDHPNTYTFTKQIAEHSVRDYQTKFPCTIVRPSMIVGSWKEPIPGWTISKNGPQGFLMGASKGVIRRLPVGKELVYDYVPVDIVVNSLLVAGFHAGVTTTKEVQIYHATSSCRNPFRWCSVEDKLNTYLHRYPLVSAVWYPHLKFLPSVQRFKISAFFVHFLPALILDAVMSIAGGRPILKRLHANVNMSLDRLEKFIFNEWSFHSDRSESLQKWLSPVDQRTFNVALEGLNWPDYFDDLTKGARIYLNKENMKNIEKARGKDTLLMVLHLGLQGTILGLIWFLFACITGMTMTKSAFIVPIFYILFSFL